MVLTHLVIKSWVKTKNHARLKHKPAGSGSQRPTLHTPAGNLIWIVLPQKQAPLVPGENKTTAVVKEMLGHLPAGTAVAADNYFHFIGLLEWAHTAGILFYGTLRKHRIPSLAVKTWLLGVPEKHEWRVVVTFPYSPKAQR